MVPYENQTLLNSLKELGVIDEKKLDSAYKKAEDSNTPLHRTLLQLELITDDNLGKLIADIAGFPFVDLNRVDVDEGIAKIVPELVAKKQSVILYEKTDKGIKAASSSPQNQEVFDLISKKTGEKIIVYYATERDIEDKLSLYKQGLQTAFDEILKKEVEKSKDKEKRESSTSKIVDTLIQYSYQNKASDLHIEPEDDESVIRFRIDGILHDVLKVDKDLHDQIVTRIKVMSKLRTDEHMSAQDGKMKSELENEELDIRVSIVPIVEGEKVVMRLLSSRSRQFALNELGMQPNDLAKVEKAYKEPNGMVLSTGPTGSGKTTSIYAILKLVNSREVNIATIEDPVEYDIEGINQIQVNPKTNLTFADGLRAILRQDPDIIFVGEVRDKETAGIAVNSAMTGHLVLSTLHTNDAATTLPRLIDMNIEPFLVASTVNVIVAQRLLRKICGHCKISVELEKNELLKGVPKEFLEKYFGLGEIVRVYKGKGCEICHDTGYDGRIGIFEVLEISESIRELITNKANSNIIAQKAREEGMTTMFEDGLTKVAQGVTTMEEVLRVTEV